jgi:predicted TIM-barrel enzyme
MMTEREQQIYQQLAACGKYYNTGKVLIGVGHIPKLPASTREEDLIQKVLLNAALKNKT